ncbi:MAG: FMN-binding protein, partial [Synergistaceae bacterium]|nr:FMN-binding protein [Synergistaceae bacterium]
MLKKFFAVLFILVMISSTAFAAEMSLSDVNNFLNTSAKLGEGSKANAVAVIPFSHIDGPKEEDLFYAFVPFKYVSRNYVKYQIAFISCTCRPADLNVWSTAYVELTLPSSGKIADSEVKVFSFDKDSTGHYLGGFWGDSDPPPTSPKSTYEKFKAEMIPYYIGKTYAQIKGLNTIDDIKDSNFKVDAWTGATVSSNNILRAIQAIFAYHATD